MREDVKWWTLRDVGELLDKAVAKDLIKEGSDYDFLRDQPKYNNKDVKPEELHWNTRLWDDYSKVEPFYIDDVTSEFEKYPQKDESYKKYLM